MRLEVLHSGGGEMPETVICYCTVVRGRLKGTTTVYKHHVHSAMPLKPRCTLGYMRAPWQLWCPCQNCEHIIDKATEHHGMKEEARSRLTDPFRGGTWSWFSCSPQITGTPPPHAEFERKHNWLYKSAVNWCKQSLMQTESSQVSTMSE